MVVALDLESHGFSLAEVDDPRVLARSLEDACALRGEPRQQTSRVLVGAMLRPEEREDRELEVVGSPSEQFADALELSVGQTERTVERPLRDRAQGATHDIARGGPWRLACANGAWIFAAPCDRRCD